MSGEIWTRFRAGFEGQIGGHSMGPEMYEHGYHCQQEIGSKFLISLLAKGYTHSWLGRREYHCCLVIRPAG